jgi:hypothetical protein
MLGAMQRARVSMVAVVVLASTGCPPERIPPGGPTPGAKGFARTTLHNESPSAICSITGCFLSAYHVGPEPHVRVSSEHPIEAGAAVLLDVPSCGDELQAATCDHQRTLVVARDGDVLRIR